MTKNSRPLIKIRWLRFRTSNVLKLYVDYTNNMILHKY